jgi:hypothetical protein
VNRNGHYQFQRCGSCIHLPQPATPANSKEARIFNVPSEQYVNHDSRPMGFFRKGSPKSSQVCFSAQRRRKSSIDLLSRRTPAVDLTIKQLSRDILYPPYPPFAISILDFFLTATGLRVCAGR